MRELICIVGLPGAGKSELAKSVAQTLTSQKPDFPLPDKFYNGYYSPISLTTTHKECHVRVIDDPKNGIEELVDAMRSPLADVVILADPRLTAPGSIKKVLELVGPKIASSCIFFENDAVQSLKNIERRGNRGPSVLKTEVQSFSNNYNVESLKRVSEQLGAKTLILPTFHAPVIGVPEVDAAVDGLGACGLSLECMVGKSGPKYSAPFFLVSTFDSHGMDGGGYNSDATSYKNTPTPEHERFGDFDALIELLNPDISFKAYRAVKAECVKEVEWSTSGYYGNYSHMQAKYVDVRDVAAYMQSIGVLTNRNILQETDVDV